MTLELEHNDFTTKNEDHQSEQFFGIHLSQENRNILSQIAKSYKLEFFSCNVFRARDHLFNLKHITLSSSKLMEFPGILGEFSNLEHLDLSDNKLTSLSDSALKLGKLKTLILGNLYGGNLINMFPHDFFSKLPNLENLSVSNNKFEYLPENIYMGSNLKYLDFSYNKLSNINPVIKYCKKLKSIKINNNYISSIPLEILGMNLEILDLSNNLISFIPNEFAYVKWLLLTGNPIFKSMRPEALNNFDTEISSFNEYSNIKEISLIPKELSFCKILSLKELCTRSILMHDIKVNINFVPKTLEKIFKTSGKPCNSCETFYVKECIEHYGYKKIYGRNNLTKFNFCSNNCKKQCFYKSQNPKQKTKERNYKIKEFNCSQLPIDSLFNCDSNTNKDLEW